MYYFRDFYTKQKLLFYYKSVSRSLLAFQLFFLSKLCGLISILQLATLIGDQFVVWIKKKTAQNGQIGRLTVPSDDATSQVELSVDRRKSGQWTKRDGLDGTYILNIYDL